MKRSESSSAAAYRSLLSDAQARIDLLAFLPEDRPLGWGKTVISVLVFCAVMILAGTALGRAIDNLLPFPDYILADYVPLLQAPVPHQALKGGDGLCYCIAAASIVAKVTRDKLMEEADQQYPGYGFARHKGYATRLHLRELAYRGPCPIHRRSFSPRRP